MTQFYFLTFTLMTDYDLNERYQREVEYFERDPLHIEFND